MPQVSSNHCHSWLRHRSPPATAIVGYATGLLQPLPQLVTPQVSSNHCHSWLRHKYPKTVSHLAVFRWCSKWQYVCNRHLLPDNWTYSTGSHGNLAKHAYTFNFRDSCGLEKCSRTLKRYKRVKQNDSGHHARSGIDNKLFILSGKFASLVVPRRGPPVGLTLIITH